VFAALVVEKRPSDGIFAKLKGILSGPKSWVEPGEACGAQYAVIHATEGWRGLDWEEIERLAMEYSRRILLPEGTAPPPGSLLRPYTTDQFDRLVLLHTACSLIHRTRMPMYRRVLGLLDADGSHAYMLPQLLKYYTAVRVVTASRPLYEAASERMMEELGAPVMVDSEISSLSDCVLVLCPSAYVPDGECALSCPVLCGGTLRLRRRFDCIDSLRVGLPAAAQPPEGISEHLFAGALYELCEAMSVRPVARSLLYNRRISSLDEAVHAVLQNVLSIENPKFIRL